MLIFPIPPVTLVSVPSLPIIIGSTDILIFHCFFQFTGRVLVCISLFAFFPFYPMVSYTAGFLFCWLSLSFVYWRRLDELLSQNPKLFFAPHFLGHIMHYAYTICQHHHHHLVPLARISLVLSRHFSLLFITSGRFSGLHPVSSHSYWMYVRAGRPAFVRPYVGVHRSTSLMSSSLLL